jgi:formylglycine-generating enzyme required for sulfatase activity
MMEARTIPFLFIVALVVAVVAPRLWQPVHFEFASVSPSLKVMRHEVTIAQWRQCYVEKACSEMPNRGLGASDDEFPVTGVNWFDVREYMAWARQRSGLKLRLPTIEEWRLASHLAMAEPKLLFDDPRLAWAAEYGTEKKQDPTLRRAGGFGVTPEGTTDFAGNVWEWTSSCASKGFVDKDADYCPAFKVAGEHEAVLSVFVRDPAIGGCSSGVPPIHLGLRLVVSD